MSMQPQSPRQPMSPRALLPNASFSSQGTPRLKSLTPNHDEGTDTQTIRVMTRVRPFNKWEKEKSELENKKLEPCIVMREGANGAQCCAVVDPETGIEREAFEFDECFWTMPLEECCTEKPFADQKYVYDRSGSHALRAAFQGYNCCIFAYGQTGSGKTYSMLGSPEEPGISPQLCDDLFAKIEKLSQTTPTTKIEIDCTFMEIYNEKVRDLFNKKHKEGDYEPAKVRLHPQKGVYVDGLLRKAASTAAQVKFFIERGAKERAMAETKMNAHSSRSHALFQIQIIQKNILEGTVRTSTINLVDLAGSERVKNSQVTGDALKEAQNINQSLSTLRKVIDTLIDNSKLKPNSKQRRIPPFRESVLTWVLSDSLGGNSKTMMMTAISPHIVNVEETISTLRYALRAKAIVCSAKVNEEKSSALLSSMREEIKNLQAQLLGGSLGSSGSCGMPEEILRQIEEREHEMVKLEEFFRKKEAEMNKQLDMQFERSENLKVQISQRKHQQFADAFRNAFLIKRNYEELTSTKMLLESKTKEAEDLRDTVSELERKITTVQDAKRDVEQTLAGTYKSLQEVCDISGKAFGVPVPFEVQSTAALEDFVENLKTAAPPSSAHRGRMPSDAFERQRYIAQYNPLYVTPRALSAPPGQKLAAESVQTIIRMQSDLRGHFTRAAAAEKAAAAKATADKAAAKKAALEKAGAAKVAASPEAAAKKAAARTMADKAAAKKADAQKAAAAKAAAEIGAADFAAAFAEIAAARTAAKAAARATNPDTAAQKAAARAAADKAALKKATAAKAAATKSSSRSPPPIPPLNLSRGSSSQRFSSKQYT